MDKKRIKLRANPEETEIMEMAKFYFLNSKYDEAIAELEKVLAINPGNAEAYYNLGLIYENRNQMEQARDMYEKALTIEPSYKLAREHLNKLIGIANE
jgi:Flp pilus assembly protein TadD